MFGYILHILKRIKNTRPQLVRPLDALITMWDRSHLKPVTYFGYLIPYSLWWAKDGVLVCGGKGDPLGVLQTDLEFDNIAKQLQAPVIKLSEHVSYLKLWDEGAKTETEARIAMDQYMTRLEMLSRMTLAALRRGNQAIH